VGEREQRWVGGGTEGKGSSGGRRVGETAFNFLEAWISKVKEQFLTSSSD